MVGSGLTNDCEYTKDLWKMAKAANERGSHPPYAVPSPSYQERQKDLHGCYHEWARKRLGLILQATSFEIELALMTDYLQGRSASAKLGSPVCYRACRQQAIRA